MRQRHLAIIAIMLSRLAGAASYAAEETVGLPGAAPGAKEDNHLPFQQDDEGRTIGAHKKAMSDQVIENELPRAGCRQ